MERDLYEYHETLRKVKTKSGWVKGIRGNNPSYTVFKGIPYAQPPIGDLRWKAPQEVEAWEGVKKCDEYSAIPLQFRGNMGRIPNDDMYQKEFYQYREPMSEDCLYLNVWTPAKRPDEKLPVMLWIHGGANICGSGTEIQVDGEGFNKRGVIMISFNYRVGILGFMAHPELSAESPDSSSGNYGLLDQIAALKWVRDNIEAFGGDPENITIFGQSSGAANCNILTCSPLTKGMIKGAIMESAPSLGDIYVHRSPSDDYASLDEAESIGQGLVQKAKCQSIEQMRQLDYESLLALSRVETEDIKNGPIMIFPVVIDRHVLYDYPARLIYRGENHDIHYLMGSTADEKVAWNQLSREDVPKFAEKFGSKEKDFIALSDSLNEEDFAKCMEDTGELKNVILAENCLKHGRKPAYLYYFMRDLPGENGGSFHTCEMWYHFSTLGRCWRPFIGADYDMSEEIADYWANFAASGDPNKGAHPMRDNKITWEPYTSDNKRYMALDLERRMIRKPFRKMQQFFLDYIVYDQPIV